MNNPKKLTKSKKNRVVAGVAGGLGEYLNLDPLVFRILFVVFTFAGGFGAIAYLVLLIMMPDPYPVIFQDDNSEQSYQNVENHQNEQDYQNYQNYQDVRMNYPKAKNAAKIVPFSIGFLFMFIGTFLLFSKILRFNWSEFFFPSILIGAGSGILIVSILSKKQKR